VTLPTPYYDHGGITIYHGDCREIMPLLPKVDLVLTDPPYGVDYDGGLLNRNRRDRLHGDDHDVYGWAMPLIFDRCRGPVYVFFAGTRAPEVMGAARAAGAEVRSMLIWNKTNATYGALGAHYKFRHEPFLYCLGRGATARWIGPTTEATVWDGPRNARNAAHPTEKPVWLCARAIRNHDAALILDPFMGSGTTLRAAKDMNRRAIGIEIEEKYCEIAAKRLAQEVLPW
jgi:DNA modification methylase